VLGLRRPAPGPVPLFEGLFEAPDKALQLTSFDYWSRTQIRSLQTQQIERVINQRDLLADPVRLKQRKRRFSGFIKRSDLAVEIFRYFPLTRPEGWQPTGEENFWSCPRGACSDGGE